MVQYPGREMSGMGFVGTAALPQSPLRVSTSCPMQVKTSFVGSNTLQPPQRRATLSSAGRQSNRITPKATDTTTDYFVYVENHSNNPMNFFIFQEPAEYVGGEQVYSNSLGSGYLPAVHPLVDSQLSFSIEMQFRAGAQRQTVPLEPGDIQVGKVSTALVKTRSMTGSDLTMSNMSVDRNGMPDLAPAVEDGSVMKGAFRVSTPPFLPGEGPFNVGTATVVNGVIMLSNFITAKPNNNVDIRPIVKFYIATGTFTPGQVVDFTQSSVGSALLDATSGQTRFLVLYKADGTFEVTTP